MAQRSQPVATGGKWDGRKNGSIRRKPLPRVATGCLRRSMARVHTRKEGVASLAPQRAPSPTNPRAHRTGPRGSDTYCFLERGSEGGDDREQLDLAKGGLQPERDHRLGRGARRRLAREVGLNLLDALGEGGIGVLAAPPLLRIIA